MHRDPYRSLSGYDTKNEEKCGHYKLEIWKRTQLSATAFFESVAVSRFPPCGRSAVTASVVGGEDNLTIQLIPFLQSGELAQLYPSGGLDVSTWFIVSPEPAGGGGGRGRVERAPEGPPGGLRGEVGGEGRDGLGVVAGVVGELDGDGLGGALGHRPVQLLDGPLGLDALVEADEAHSLGESC